MKGLLAILLVLAVAFILADHSLRAFQTAAHLHASPPYSRFLNFCEFPLLLS